LLSEDGGGAASSDEPEPVGPQVPFVIESFLFPGCAERLAGTASGPHRSIIGPSGLTQGKAPKATPGKKMALGESCKVAGSKIDN